MKSNMKNISDLEKLEIIKDKNGQYIYTVLMVWMMEYTPKEIKEITQGNESINLFPYYVKTKVIHGITRADGPLDYAGVVKHHIWEESERWGVCEESIHVLAVYPGHLTDQYELENEIRLAHNREKRAEVKERKKKLKKDS